MKTGKYINADFVIARNEMTKQSQSFVKACRNRSAFTMVEILTVVVIIAVLIGILAPALNSIRKMARNVKQKAQIASIEIGINLYKNESVFGDYPPSRGYNEINAAKYCGAQTLAEAMFGQDLLGVDPNTIYQPNEIGTGRLYADANDRKGPYLDRSHINVLSGGNIYNNAGSLIEPDMYLICDVFDSLKKNVTFRNTVSKTVNVGTPILYYKANTSQTNNDNRGATDRNIYDYKDNENLIRLGAVVKNTKHSFDPSSDGVNKFYTFITDVMATTTINRPLRPDSFLLISAGNDGLYGTPDDICNFEPNIE